MILEYLIRRIEEEDPEVADALREVGRELQVINTSLELIDTENIDGDMGDLEYLSWR